MSATTLRSRRARIAVGLAGVAAVLTACTASADSTDGATPTADSVVAAPSGVSHGWYSCASALRTDTVIGQVAPGTRLRIATTVAPITSIVANIAADRADVVGVVPEGTNSHTFEPKPSDARALAEADLVIMNGLDLEAPTKKLATANLAKGAAIVELGPLTISPAEQIFDASFPKEAGKPNPHLWTNPPMAACYARSAADALGVADPANAKAYNDNAEALIAKIEALDHAFVAASATMKAQNRALLTYHDAYAYFARHYGWTVVGAIQVSDFDEPTAKEVKSLIKQVKTLGVPAIFGSEVFPSPVLEQIGKEAGVAYVDTLRDDDLPGAPGEAEHSYLGLMRFDLATMVKALGGNPVALDHVDVADIAPDRAVYPQ